jgi:zinc transporter, ZIP family
LLQTILIYLGRCYEGGYDDVSLVQTALLGGIAGLTIFLGLPVARLRIVTRPHLAFLNTIAVGILLFLFVEVMEHAFEPVEEAVVDGGPAGLLILILIVGFGAGLMSLVYYARRFLRNGHTAQRLALLIATGIGLHNFSEGLAIGSSAQAGAMALALTLIVGFGLHNATEGFGIAAPLAAEKKANWGLLTLCGLVAGGPTFLGTIVGYSYASEVLSLLFLALAGGAILYVVGELLVVGRKLDAPAWSGWGLTVGIMAGFLTELVLASAGA